MTKPLKLSRDQLYAEVWRRPIGHIARDWGIHSATLRAACKDLRVPLPGGGYWAAVRAGNAPPPPALPNHDGVISVVFDLQTHKSLVKRLREDDQLAALKLQHHGVASPDSAEAAQRTLVPVAVWANTVFGTHKPHPNTLRRWISDGRFHPPATKIGRTWWVTPDAEYVGD